MRYYIEVAGKTFAVRIDGDAVVIDDEKVDAAIVRVAGTPVWQLSLNGQSHRIVAQKGEARGAWDIHLAGQRVSAQVVDERTRAIRAMTNHAGASHGPKPMRAPMPGMIVRVEVKPGDRVKAGQGLVVMEAMKMENELKAEAAGVISNVLVTESTAVEKGALLIEFAAHA